MLRQVLSYIVGRPRLRKIVTGNPVVRNLAGRFVAGDDLTAAIEVLQRLEARGIGGVLNHIGTHVKDESQAVGAADAIIEALHRVSEKGLDVQFSIKPTQIGLDIGEAMCKQQLRRILDCSQSYGVVIFIDMEESRYVDCTLQIFEEMRETYGADAVGIVLQSYLRNRTSDLDWQIAMGSRIRLVKGGYWETADTVYRKSKDIDRAFRGDIELLLGRGRLPAIATHDPRFLMLVPQIAAQKGLDTQDYELQLLYGVRSDLQDRLVRSGCQVRCYVPYGHDWYAYLLGCLRRVPQELVRRATQRVNSPKWQVVKG